MAEATMVTVELFGVPRLRAGRAELRVRAGTVAEALAALERECPGLAGLVCEGRLNPQYLLSVDGYCFVGDLDQGVDSGDRLLLLSADAGG
jgi:molybdopterin converting factor small subunit